MPDPKTLLKDHLYKIICGGAGLLISIAIIYWGFWNTVLTLVVMGVGVFVGSLFDSGDLFEHDDKFED